MIHPKYKQFLTTHSIAPQILNINPNKIIHTTNLILSLSLVSTHNHHQKPPPPQARLNPKLSQATSHNTTKIKSTTTSKPKSIKPTTQKLKAKNNNNNNNNNKTKPTKASLSNLDLRHEFLAKTMVVDLGIVGFLLWWPIGLLNTTIEERESISNMVDQHNHWQHPIFSSILHQLLF